MRHNGSVCLVHGQRRTHLSPGLQVLNSARATGSMSCSNFIPAFACGARSMEGTHVPLNDPNICVLIVNSGVKHQLSGSEYPLRRSQCEEAARILKVDFLRDVTREDLEGEVCFDFASNFI